VNSFVAMCEAIGSWHVSTLDTSCPEVVHNGQHDTCQFHFELGLYFSEPYVMIFTAY